MCELTTFVERDGDAAFHIVVGTVKVIRIEANPRKNTANARRPESQAVRVVVFCVDERNRDTWASSMSVSILEALNLMQEFGVDFGEVEVSLLAQGWEAEIAHMKQQITMF